MAFKYNPPTRSFCKVCEEISKKQKNPIILTSNGKASSANNFPFHNWYNFVLGYTPEFPEYVIKKNKINSKHFVVDPFMGSGTTLVTCKQNKIKSAGVDANDYFIDVAETKLQWGLNTKELISLRNKVFNKFSEELDKIDFGIPLKNGELNFSKSQKIDYKEILSKNTVEFLDPRYISERPLCKLIVLKKVISKVVPLAYRNFYNLALSSILVPASNIRYGPGFGVTKPKVDADVLKLFKTKVERMIKDIEKYNDSNTIISEVHHGDARVLDKVFKASSIDFMITSPPYPGDHEYTKHTKLELIFMGYAGSLTEFRVIKKRMLRGSTTNIYKEDNDREPITDIESIKEVTCLIDERLKADNATSGFEKLYTKLVWEYFGGMYKVFESAKKVLKKGGKFSLLVSDSHAFKMVHIKTADILAEVALKAGFKDFEIELWQHKVSTSHKYDLNENILTVIK